MLIISQQVGQRRCSKLILYQDKERELEEFRDEVFYLKREK